MTDDKYKAARQELEERFGVTLSKLPPDRQELAYDLMREKTKVAELEARIERMRNNLNSAPFDHPEEDDE